MILFYPAMALNMVLTSIVGQCIGAQRIDRAKNYLKLALKYGIVVSSVLSAVVIFFSKQLAKLFVSNVAVTNVVSHYFLIVSIGYVLYTITSCYFRYFKWYRKTNKKYDTNDILLYYYSYSFCLSIILAGRKFKWCLDSDFNQSHSRLHYNYF